MNSLLQGRRVVLTGVTSGIGLATTRKLLDASADVIGVGRNAEKLHALSAECGERFEPLCVDLADPAQRSVAVARLQRLSPGPHVLINNAADCVFESPLQLDAARLAQLFEVNVLACIELARAASGVMSDGGQIVQLSSVTGKQVLDARFASYGVTKASIDHLMQALRLELHPRGIAVTSIVPGLVDTPIYDKVSGFEHVASKFRQGIPEWLSPDDVADTILWTLCRPAHVVVSEITVLPKGQAR